MKNKVDKQNLVNELKQFTGTLAYTKLNPNSLLTDGALYLAETIGCYWLFDLFYSHLVTQNYYENFACLKMYVSNSSALVRITNGNEVVLASETIEYTDFLLDEIVLFACLNRELWVMMLPSEY
jgi:hypothetical protein